MPAGNRIPVRFMDDEEGAGDGGAGGGQTPEELGRASSYEGETEMRQRTNRGGESDAGRADERDQAGAPRESELPENREELDTAGREPGGAQDPSARGNLSVSSEVELLAAQAEARLIEDELQKAKSERQELHDLLARRQADFENYRKRTDRERAETYQRVAGEVASQILPVLDNMRRAVVAEASVEAGESQEFRNFLHGVELITKQLNGVLESLGVVPVETVGRHFDPHVHEAVATEQTEEFEPDTVTQEIQRGYRIGDRLLRPAMVKVATR
ncbi:MAG TPA: nucleotide exchange factor GrpE [Pyrinomonadaceae bacterium]|nr:nucleotide exchange factor GrpE [Pyrinomonadaceae bacterium]